MVYDPEPFGEMQIRRAQEQRLEQKAELYSELHPDEVAPPKRHPLQRLWERLRGRRGQHGDDLGLG